MPRNPSTGVYTAPDNSWNPAVAGTVIDPDDWNATQDDYAAALNDAVLFTDPQSLSDGEQEQARENIGLGDFGPGPTTATAGSVMATDLEWGAAADIAIYETLAGLWSAGKVYNGASFAKSFGASDSSAPGQEYLWPNFATISLAIATGSTNAVVGNLAIAYAKTENSEIFGQNIIAVSDPGLTSVKLVGAEIDVQPSEVTVGAGSAGLYLNVFTAPNLGPAIQTGGVGGGSWSSGVVLDGISSSGAGMAPNAGTEMGALLHTGVATYSLDAVVVSNTHKIRLSGTASSHAKIYNDNSNNIRWVLGSGGLAIRNNADTISLAFFNDTGSLQLGAAGAAQGLLALSGVTSGTVSLAVQAAAGSWTLTLPITDGNSGQVLQTDGTGATTWATLAASDLSNGTTGSGNVVLASAPTLVTPVLGVATGTSIALGGTLAQTLTIYDATSFQIRFGSSTTNLHYDFGRSTSNGLATLYGYQSGFNGLVVTGTDGEHGRIAAGGVRSETSMVVKDGITAPGATSGYAKIYVDTADGDLKVVFGDGTVKTLATDT
jgi:hypothetical protein